MLAGLVDLQFAALGAAPSAARRSHIVPAPNTHDTHDTKERKPERDDQPFGRLVQVSKRERERAGGVVPVLVYVVIEHSGQEVRQSYGPVRVCVVTMRDLVVGVVVLPGGGRVGLRRELGHLVRYLRAEVGRRSERVRLNVVHQEREKATIIAACPPQSASCDGVHVRVR